LKWAHLLHPDLLQVALVEHEERLQIEPVFLEQRNVLGRVEADLWSIL
jgi:hypothetical protein